VTVSGCSRKDEPRDRPGPFIDSRTVEPHIETICHKLGVRTRVELVVKLFGSHDDADVPKTNIPARRTSLIGRETQMADIVNMLSLMCREAARS
jgi:hypothetical protein